MCSLRICMLHLFLLDATSNNPTPDGLNITTGNVCMLIDLTTATENDIDAIKQVITKFMEESCEHCQTCQLEQHEKREESD